MALKQTFKQILAALVNYTVRGIRILKALIAETKLKKTAFIERKQHVNIKRENINKTNLSTELQDFLKHIPNNDFFLLRLVCVHYPFKEKEIVNFCIGIKVGEWHLLRG